MTSYNVFAIKFKDGTYYAGCNKSNAKTILGAQLYRSKKTAESMIEKSVNFPSYEKETLKFIEVELKEYED